MHSYDLSVHDATLLACDQHGDHLHQNGTSIFYACQIAKITTWIMKGVIVDDRTLSEGNSMALRGMRTDVQRVLFPARTVLRLSPHGTRALGSSSACSADDAAQGLGHAESGYDILACNHLACLLVPLFQSETSQYTGRLSVLSRKAQVETLTRSLSFSRKIHS